VTVCGPVGDGFAEVDIVEDVIESETEVAPPVPREVDVTDFVVELVLVGMMAEMLSM
jgi:hypothetical protein